LSRRRAQLGSAAASRDGAKKAPAFYIVGGGPANERRSIVAAVDEDVAAFAKPER
jgi:hypothetical protein